MPPPAQLRGRGLFAGAVAKFAVELPHHNRLLTFLCARRIVWFRR